MQPGDFVITPSWTWHDHGNDTDEPVVWLDGLDIPIVRLFDASFAEPATATTQTVSRPEGDSLARYGDNLLPVDWKPAVDLAGVQLSLRAHARGAGALAKAGTPDPSTATIALRQPGERRVARCRPSRTFVQLLPAGFGRPPYRSTDGTVFVVVEGEGREPRSATRSSAGSRATSSWCRAGHGTHPPPSEARAVQLLRPAGAGEARPVARGARREVEQVLRGTRHHALPLS